MSNKQALRLLIPSSPLCCKQDGEDHNKRENLHRFCAIPKRMSDSRVLPQILAGFLASLSAVSVGLIYAWPTPSLPKLLAEGATLQLTSSDGAWVVSALNLGGIFGPIIAALLVDRIGRKLSLSFTAVPIFLSWLFIYLGTNYAWLFFARFIGGIGTGAIFTLLPMYIGEVTQEKVRGALGVLITVMVTAGNLITYTVGPWVTREILALISAVPSIVFILTFIWMPESPYYLIMKKRSTEAANSLAWLRDTLMVKEELRRITEQVEIEQKSKGKITEIVTVPGNRKAMMIILGLLSAQQFSGTIPLLSYATLIFQQAAYSLHPNISVIIVGVVTLIFSLLAVLLVDKVGRKPLLLFSSAGTCFCLCLLAIFFHLQYANMNVSSISWLPLVTIILFNVPYSMGIGSLPNAVLSEIFPTNVKAWATMLASTYGSLLGMILIKLFQVISDAKDVFAAFYTLAAIEASFIFFIYFIVPETKNKSLKEIQDILHSHVTKSNAIIHT